MKGHFRTIVFFVFGLLAVTSFVFLFHLKFSFDFEQFFPEGDEDLEFFREFIKEFEADDNFLLVAVRRDEGVFDQQFLEKFHDFTLRSRTLPHVLESQSLTKVSYPVKTPFAITSIPAIHIDDPSRYESDKERLLADERFVHNFITPDATSLVVYLKTASQINLDQAKELMAALAGLIEGYDFEQFHFLGRPYFQQELVRMQKREIIVSAIVSALLVSLIMFWIFRRPVGIGLALVSIGLGLLLFIGFMGVTGREMNAMAALYPVLMIIVGTSDVIHIMSKYIDELRKGKSRRMAIRTTIREIGLATFLTSVTTAIGFISLVTSRVAPIRDFGLNAAVGVIIAFLTVIFFTTAVLSMFRVEQLVKIGRSQQFWERLMQWMYRITKEHPRRIGLAAVGVLVVCFIGISRITTNYDIINNLPKGQKITEDFRFFERSLTGFRPMELAVYAQNGYRADDYAVVREIDKVENHLRQFPFVRGIGSIAGVYKSINQMYGSGSPQAYAFPATEDRFRRYRRLIDEVPRLQVNVLLSKDRQKARITSRIHDIGADSIQQFGKRLDHWIAQNTDTTAVRFVQTGTGLIIDKNAGYIRRNLLQGLGMAILIISLLMAALFRNWKMMLISLVPNIFPLLLAGALLGFIGIELEAGISIVFAVVFGIAVDDTIHFLSKFKLARLAGWSVEESLRITLVETGKAIVLTTIILFFGFLVMLFSIHPPSVAVGLLISLTLFSALISDLFLLPVLIRWLIPEETASISEGREGFTPVPQMADL